MATGICCGDFPPAGGLQRADQTTTTDVRGIHIWKPIESIGKGACQGKVWIGKHIHSVSNELSSKDIPRKLSWTTTAEVAECAFCGKVTSTGDSDSACVCEKRLKNAKENRQKEGSGNLVRAAQDRHTNE